MVEGADQRETKVTRVDSILFYLALLTFVGLAASGVELAFGNRALRRLKNVSPYSGVSPPKVSVIIPARNEAKKVAQGIRSLLQQDYKNLEVMVIDDRSTDNTGAILDRLAEDHAALRVIHITELPAKWLGKNHALYLGAQLASGDILLFMDADIVMNATTVSRAVQHLTCEKLDHLTLTTRLMVPGILPQMFVGMMTLCFGLFFKPWKAKDAHSKKFIGIGAFNMVRAAAYRAIGTHTAIALRPDDDLMLGKLLKKRGFRQELLFGGDLVSVEWYSSFRELRDGLEKNSYAGVDYNLGMLIGATVAQAAAWIWPAIAMLTTGGSTQLLNLGAYLIMVVLYWDNARFHKLKTSYGVAFPAASLLFLFVLWRAVLITIRNNGIDWRGTHYSLADLRANRV